MDDDTVICPNCGGIGQRYEGYTCSACGGSGELRGANEDDDDQRIALWELEHADDPR